MFDQIIMFVKLGSVWNKESSRKEKLVWNSESNRKEKNTKKNDFLKFGFIGKNIRENQI